MATLEELIPLLDFPTFLHEKIEELKCNKTNSEEVDGFIVLYDYYAGDCLQLKNYLQNSKNRITQKKHIKRSFSWMKFAAIFIVILSIGSYIWFQNSTTNYYKTYTEKDLGLPVFMSINKNTLDAWMLDYKDKRHTKALQTGLRLLKESPSNDTILYYIGVLQLELNAPLKAEKFLSKIDLQKSVFSDKVFWLRTICKMYSDKTTAKKMLVDIASSTSFYSSKAKTLLEKEF